MKLQPGVTTGGADQHQDAADEPAVARDGGATCEVTTGGYNRGGGLINIRMLAMSQR